jgi:uncharacterized protein
MVTLSPHPPAPSRRRCHGAAVQPLAAVLLLVAALLAGLPFVEDRGTFVLYLLTGAALGYILTRSRFGFAGGIKRVWVLGEGSLTRALTISFALVAVFTAGVQWVSASSGAVPETVAQAGDAVIPGTQNVQSIGLALVLGGVLFGAGMIMAGGCASGTLADVGEGAARAMIALPFFVMGAVPGHWLRYEIGESALGSLRIDPVYLPDHVGYLGAVLLTLAGLLGVYWLVRWYEQRRKAERSHTIEQWSTDELPLAEQPAGERFRFFSARTWHSLFVTRWTFTQGAVLLAFGAMFVLVTTGKAWGVTSAFTAWGVKVLDLIGVHLDGPAFAEVNETVAKGLVNDGGSVRDVGIIVGAAVAVLLAGRFVFDRSFSRRDAAVYALGGLFMGVGARMAGGCNVGALYSAIGTFSLSGWVFGAALWAGGLAALKLLAGRLNIIPPDRHTLRDRVDAH